MPKPIYVAPTQTDHNELRYDLSPRFFIVETPHYIGIGYRDERVVCTEPIPTKYAPLMRHFGKKLDELFAGGRK